MNWSDISETVGKYAPMVGTLLGGPAGAAIGSTISSVLGAENTPEAVLEVLTNAPDAASQELRILEETNRDKYEGLLLDYEKAKMVQQAETARAEITSGSKYVAFWRPTYGYVMALSFFVNVSALSAVMVLAVLNPKDSGAVLASVSTVMGPMMAIWSVGLSVLGISVINRSRDKQVAKGFKPVGLLEGFMKGSNK